MKEKIEYPDMYCGDKKFEDCDFREFIDETDDIDDPDDAPASKELIEALGFDPDELDDDETEDAVYAGNMGFEELIRFYQKADESLTDKMDSYVRAGNWNAIKKLIKQVLGIELK